MIVWYDKTTFATRHRLGAVLRPGANDIPDKIAIKLLEIGLVSDLPPATETAPSIVEEQRDEEAPAAAVSVNPSFKED